MNVLLQCVGCMTATVFFGVLLRQPRNTHLFTALIGLNGYLVFLLMGQGTYAYLVAGLLVGLLCELTARIRQMAATSFLISAIIPLVPGLGLYRTMLYFVQNNYDQAMTAGADTLAAIMALSLALTIATAVFNGIRIPIRDDHPPAP